MNYRSLVLVCALSCAPGVAVEAAPAISGEDSAKSEQARLAPAQLDELLAPIALYPDPLIAIILPASTFPADVVLAARFIKAGGSADAIDAQPWDDSVKSLARYPEVLKWMDENLAWTSQVGSAFTLQPADLLTCTQRLRAAAHAAGNLNTTPEQHVVVERETIRIVPARTEVIYVPVYDPIVVYRPRTVNFYHPGPIVRFSTGYRTGVWLSYHCDWGYRTVVVINRPHRVHVWHNYPRWSCPAPSSGYYHHVWRPAPSKIHAVVHDSRPRLKTLPKPAQNLALSRDSTPQGVAPVRPRPQTATPRPVASTVNIAPTATSSNTGGVSPRPSRLNSLDRLPIPQDARASVGAVSRTESNRGERRGQNIVLTPPPSASPSPAAPVPVSPPASSRRIHFPTTTPAAPASSGFRTPVTAPRPAVRDTLRSGDTSRTLSPSDRPQPARILSTPAAGAPGGETRATPRPRARPASAAELPAATPVGPEAASSRSRRNP